MPDPSRRTAYEIQIRDWSSDVCSSDLLVPILLKYQAADTELVDYTVDTGCCNTVDYTLPFLVLLNKVIYWNLISGIPSVKIVTINDRNHVGTCRK